MTSLILGRRRQGKSTLALSLGISRRKAVVIWDPNSQYDLNPIVPLGKIGSWIESGCRLIVVRPSDPESQFKLLVSELWEWENYVLLIDECTVLQSSAGADTALKRLLRQAPRNVDLIQTTHRLVDTHRLTRMLSTDVFFFQTPSRVDLDMIGDEFSETLAERVQVLGEYKCAHYWLEAGGAMRWSVWDDPKEWYVRINDYESGTGTGTNG